jgi:PAS domain S-box-containing protein
VEKALASRENYDVEFRVPLPDGQVRWISSRGHVGLDGNGKPDRLLGVSIDITARKRTEEASRNANQLMVAIFNSVPGLLYLYTEDGRLIQWNRQHEEMTGYSSAELLNRRAKDWFDERNWVKAAKTIAKVFSEGYAQTEVTMTLKNGQQMPIFATGSKVMIDGMPHMVGIALDISARKQAEEKFRLMVEASPSGIVLADRAGRMVLVNVQTENLFGYSRAELIGQSVEMLVPERFRATHLGDRAGFMAKPEARAMGAGRELFALRKDGTEFPVEIGLSPIQSGEGILLLAVIVDITARRQSEREITQQRNELAHLSRVSMLGELSGSLAHELNQPLTAILSNAQAAQRFLAHLHPDLNEVRDILADIVAEDKRAGEVIRRLRLLLKKGEVQRQLLNANELVLEVLKLVRNDLVNQSIVAHTELALNPPLLHADRVSLQQVLINLVMNACDAMAGTTGQDRQFTIGTGLADNNFVLVSVSDNGTGIAPEKLEQVFAPFYTTKAQGMGLGLSVCRTIITAHGGKLWAANNSGCGATIYFTLPLAQMEQL